MKRKCDGLTIIELLVTLGIIVLLAALLLGVFSRVREQGKKSTCASNLHQIGLAYLQYCQDNGGNFPIGYPMDAVKPYIHSAQLLACPSDVGLSSMNITSFASLSKYGSSYGFNSTNNISATSCSLPKGISVPAGLAGTNEVKIGASSRVILELEKCGFFGHSWHDGWNTGPPINDARCNVCFVDGHVKFIRMYYDIDTSDTSDAACYDPPGTPNGTSVYEYQWSATP